LSDAIRGIVLRAARADDLCNTAPHCGAGSMAMVVLRRMTDIRVGDLVTYGGRVLRVRGISPMSASPRRVLLEDPDTGETLEAPIDDVDSAEDSAR
jgi:NMD protein affecting ribosome stability and mRNA decay